MKKGFTIIVAPDSFKGSISSRDVCDALEKGILKQSPDSKVIKAPLADGGEGTIDALVLNTSGRYISLEVSDPLGEPIIAHYGILGDEQTAVIEMAEASGLTLVPDNRRDPDITTTYGTGELIKNALEQGCRRIIMGIGGSATNDYGVGALQALGFSFKDERGVEIGFGCSELARVEHIDISRRHILLDNVEFLIASDVDNPLLGSTGATYMYAPQKGAAPKALLGLEHALKHFNTVVEQHFERSVSAISGAGAAGGFGAGLLAFLNGRMHSGANLVMDWIGFKQLFEKNAIDLVITGEGCMDSQTIHGKLPVAVARIAKSFSVPVIAIVGTKRAGFEAVFEHGIDSVYSISEVAESVEESMAKPKKCLVQTARKVIRQARL
ncbi:MAG: glycerate kinase [Candidatus Marinimicrobia bacterium]|nr:glycerate kinase [Candidatus Neomarinimicrobiota bacterium]